MSHSQESASTNKQGCIGWLRRILLGFIVFMVVLLIVGAIYQQWSLTQDQEKYPPTGEIYDLGDFSMHIDCQGDGDTTVILESGLGNGSVYWWDIQDTLADDTRVCAYDRTGLGWSGFMDDLPTSTRVAENLHALLEAANIAPPYILVGHSSGGLYVREYAHQYPDEVVAMLLIDSSHENQGSRMPAEVSGLDNPPILNICPILAPFGILRVLGVAESVLADAPLSEDAMQMTIASMNRNRFCEAFIKEREALAMDNNRDTAPQTLGDLSLIVLTHGRSSLDNPDQIPPSMPISVLEASESTWLTLQEELAALSTNSQHIVVEDAGHMIQVDRPDVVIDAIRELLNLTN